MAIVPMKKMLICGAKEDESAILRWLQRQKNFHLSPFEEEGLSAPEVKESLLLAEKRAGLAESALKVLQNYAPAEGGLLASLSGARELNFQEWLERSENSAQASRLAEDILQKDKQLADAQARAARAGVQIEGLAPWMELGLPLDFSGTASCRSLIGALPGSWTEEAIRQYLAESCPGMECYALEMLKGDASQTPLQLTAIQDEAGALEDALRRKGFAKPLVSSSQTPKEAKQALQFERAAAISEAKELEAAIKAAASRRGELEFLYDDATLEAARLGAFGKSAASQRAFFISGYAPESLAPALAEKLEEKFTASVLISDAGEDAPVLLRNNALASPTESVVESYGLPGEGETDPTSIMAIFYYFLFGLMLSDAGYGLLMIIGCGILLKKFPKMQRSSRQMFTMFFWCGVSTFIWGILFGGFFGDAIDVIGHTFFGVPADKAIFKPIWFAPLEKPMKLLVYSFLFGIIHLFVGLGIKGYQLLKQKKTMDFIGGVLSWYLLLIGLILMLIPSDLFGSISGSPIPLPGWVQTIAKFMALIGAIGLLLFSAWDRKNIGLRLALGAYELYGITGWLSDVLSYSRLLALGLATGVIASVINSMASMFGGGVGGAVAFVVIFLVGHTLNMAINLLGAYVHTNRLQYVEFFGKFYDGGGEVFDPLTVDNTKYYHMEEH